MIDFFYQHEQPQQQQQNMHQNGMHDTWCTKQSIYLKRLAA